jgi:hypothetical protein
MVRAPATLDGQRVRAVGRGRCDDAQRSANRFARIRREQSGAVDAEGVASQLSHRVLAEGRCELMCKQSADSRVRIELFRRRFFYQLKKSQ